MKTTIQVTEKTRKKIRLLASELDCSYEEALKALIADPKETAKRLKNEYSPVAIPKKLADTIKADLKDTGFETVSDYVTFVLREIFGGNKQAGEVRNRLKKLGYL